MSSPLLAPVSISPDSDLSRLRKHGSTPEEEKARLKKATKEFESFFMHYMLKTMRQTIPKSEEGKNGPMSGSMGKEIFTDMFDMEVARKVSGRSDGSISSILYSSLEKSLDNKVVRAEPSNSPIPIKGNEQERFPVEKEALPVNQERRFMERPLPQQTIPVSRRTTNQSDMIRQRFGQIIDDAAQASQLDSALITSMIRVESGGDPGAISPAGAKGLMQLIDSTARELGVKDSLDPKENIHGGSRYMRQMLDRFGDLKLALAAYNAGPAAVERYGGIPPFEETQGYVERVTGILDSTLKLK